MDYRHSMLARCLSVILSVFVVLTMMPTVAIAEENGDAQQVQQEQTEKASEPEKKEEKAEPAPAPVAEPEKPAEPEPAPAAEEPSKEEAKDISSENVSSEEAPAAAPEEAKAEEKPEEEKEKEKEEYPAQTLTANAGGVKVTLKAPEGALPKGAKLKANQVGQKYINAVEDTLEAQGRELTDAVAIDVTPVDKDGKEIQPKKSVSVTFSGTGLDLEAGDSVAFYRVSDDASSVTNMGGGGNANSGTFSTNHFTIYVYGTGSATNQNADPSGRSTNTASTPYELDYGDSVHIYDDDSSNSYTWDIASGGSYVEMTNGTGTDYRRHAYIENKNTGSTPQLVHITHGSSADRHYYILAKPQFTTATVIFDPGEHGTWAASDETYADVNIGSATPTFGTKSDAKTTDCDAGYTFTGWDPGLESTVTGDQTYTAQWEPNTDTPYTVEFYYMDKDTEDYPTEATSSDPRTGTTDTTASVTDDDKTPTDNGYELDEDMSSDWSGNIDGDGTRVLKVYFKLSEYEVVYDPGTQGTWTADEETYDGLHYDDATPAFGGDTDTDHNPGYIFTGWDPATIAPKVTDNATYTAQWEAEEYGITYDYAEGTKPATDNPTTYTVEDDITIDQEPTRTGYKFLGWTSDEMSTPITDPTTPVEWSAGDETGDKTFTANWAKIVTLTYDKNSSPDAAEVPDPVTNLIKGDTVELGTATREGYAFKSWNTQADGEGESYGAGIEFEMPDENDVTLYAQWESKTVNVTYYVDGSQIHEDKAVAANNDYYVVISETPTKENYLFGGWSKTEGATDAEYGPKSYCPTEEEDIDLYAVWIPFNLDNLEMETTSLTAKGKTVPYNGEEYSISDVEEMDCDRPEERKYGPDYVKVSEHKADEVHHNIYAYVAPINASGTNVGTYNTPTYARLYTHNQRTGNFDPLTGEGQGIPVNNHELIITPATVKILSTESDTKVYDGEPLTAGGNLRFAGGNASFTYEGTDVELINGETLFVRTTGSQTELGESDNTYQIDWSKSTANKVNYIIDDSEATIGKLKVIGNTVKYDGNASDATDVPKGTDTAGKEYTLAEKEPSRPHYKFVKWNTKADGSGDDYKPGDTYEFSGVPQTVTFYAVWEAEKVKITYDPNGGTFRGSSDPTVIEYKYGETITIAEEATRDGYEFLYWMGSEYYPGDDYVVTEDHTFVAQWEKVAEKETDKKDTKKKKKSVETGDNTFMINWYMLMIISQILFFGILTSRTRKNRSK